ncbi:MAG: SRPBCC domain-containing protein [Planctomycetes bacterium]|nr:SRPBCC domain-containing protein [Planctomycetota bacterium]
MRPFLCLCLILLSATTMLAQDPPAEGEDIPAAKPAARVGEFWYGMYLPDGTPEGYARIVTTETKQGGKHFYWELHLAYEGGTYEEERKITFDKEGELTYSEFKSGLTHMLAARAGNVMVGKSGVDDLRVEIVEGAVTGMGFLIAASMPHKQGTVVKRTEYNEADNLKLLGETTFTVTGEEKVKLAEGETSAWRIDITRANGSKLPVWVNEKHEIVQIDWGTNNLMKLHRESTKHLFSPKPPTLDQLEPDDKSRLVLSGNLPGFDLDEMWKLWTTTEGQAKWWAPESEIGTKVGDKYELRWPDPKNEGKYVYELQGKITHWEANKKLGYTWHWSYEPAEQVLNVEIEFEAIKGGVRLKITHGKFDVANDDQANRQSLHQGWEWFCTKLKSLKKD